jgi:hypothetical protein
MATAVSLLVSSEPQWVSLNNNYYADIKFDYIYKRWYYDLYKNDELVCAGISLTKDCPTLKGISSIYLGVVENIANKTEYEPFVELGKKLMLIEVTE